jgi:hypothetical protein
MQKKVLSMPPSGSAFSSCFSPDVGSCAVICKSRCHATVQQWA